MTTGNRPRPLSDLVPGLTKGIFGKKNLLFGKMVVEWANIAGPDISAHTIPLDLKFSKKSGENQAVLYLSVQPAFALELSYQQNLLKERLNMFFGYSAIKDIKIVQNSEVLRKKALKPHRARALSIDEKTKIDDMVGKIKESDLQTALKNLGKAILSRQDKKS